MAANTKDIVLRIEAVTNQDVVESYGKEIDGLLGSYDKWIQTVQESTAIIDGLNKKVKQGQTLSDAEIRSLNEEKAKRAEALRLMRQEDKIRTSANGSLKQQQLLLSKVNDAIRKMTAEQKKANPELIKFQKALYDHVKGVNAEMGNFQMNVGNYPQLLQQILPVQSQVGQGLMQLGKSAGLSTGALTALGVALGAGVAAYKGFQQAMELTQTVGDAVAIKMEGWGAAWDKFVRMAVSLDFSNFIKNLRDAKKAGEELATELDELFERNNALRIAEAQASLQQEKNLQTMRDQTKSIKERKEAGEAYIASVRELAIVEQDIAQQEFDARLQNFAVQTGASEEDILFYIKNYNKYREVKEAVSDEEKRFIAISSKYNNANDEMTSQLVNSWIKVETAIANGERRVTRAVTTVNGLIARDNGGTTKAATKLTQEEIYRQYSYDTDKAMRQMVVNAMDDIAAAMEEEVPRLEHVAIPEDNRSPFAKMLGVTPEELDSIKSQAMQAAQQIYGSIQQAAQEASQRRLDNELKAVETEAEREKAILKAKLDSGVLNEKQYEKKIAEIDKQAEARREEAQKEAFEREKRWNIASAFMNMALGVTKALTQLPPPAKWIEAAQVTTTGLAQIATISAQKFARGGELHGASHAQGGIQGRIQGHNIELEGEEVVINKRSAHKYRNLLSYINSDNGWGVDFAGVRGSGGYRPQLKYARGGVLGSYDFSPASVPQASILQKQMERQVEQTESLIAATNRRIDRLQVQVNISDIEGASNTKRVHINRAKL